MQQNYLPDRECRFLLTTREYDTVRCFARQHFGEYCGYAQEYLYAARGSSGDASLRPEIGTIPYLLGDL